ncbi:hypothetical protein DVP09_14165 [Yersinia enterocolitica]|nr:hypothetical protein [Yersinia enterocolitica]EKN5052161.1 hypothetical protein [Yersinia enterocolitica]EKN5096047.1 hypothetical protein [Yersinia enterocolitica]EKN6089472.1 hypothetical protein [Yersinia enterocolitica]EKN6384779.1 hypothetical protein [Yersinia enterocolitica]
MNSVEETGRHSGHYFFILTHHSNKERKRVGYIWFLPSMVLSDWIDTNDNFPFVAKCFIKSTQMIKMLKNRGFNLFSTSQTGTQLLVRYPKNILSP